MTDDEGVTYTRDLVVDEHWRPGSTIPWRDTREVVETADRCPDCGKVPGKRQPTVGGRRDELTLEECHTCGAAWTGRIGARG